MKKRLYIALLIFSFLNGQCVYGQIDYKDNFEIATKIGDQIKFIRKPDILRVKVQCNTVINFMKTDTFAATIFIGVCNGVRFSSSSATSSLMHE